MPSVGRLIETEDDLARGAARLVAAEPRFAGALARCGPLPLRRRTDGFAALVEIVVGQMISTAAAKAISARLAAAGLGEAAALRRASPQALADCGLSRPKIRALQSLAATEPDYAALRRAPDEQAIAALVELPGIGRWSAEIYALSALGRADVFPAGDLALREAARNLFGLPERPSEATLRDMARAWSPWRAVAARALWNYYRIDKGREGQIL